MGAGDFHITVPINQAYFGFGDAVCVPVIQWIAREYLNVVLEDHLMPIPPGAPRKNVKYGKTL